jgi:hypothetical protein
MSGSEDKGVCSLIRPPAATTVVVQHRPSLCCTTTAAIHRGQALKVTAGSLTVCQTVPSCLPPQLSYCTYEVTAAALMSPTAFKAQYPRAGPTASGLQTTTTQLAAVCYLTSSSYLNLEFHSISPEKLGGFMPGSCPVVKVVSCYSMLHVANLHALAIETGHAGASTGLPS